LTGVKYVNPEELVQKAKGLVNPKKLTGETISGEVGSGLITDKGNVYVGVSVHASCGIGFCGEVNAIGSMLIGGETRIETIVSVGEDGEILPPCGRCRETMYQVDMKNADTNVILAKGKVMKLRDLLPEYWQ
jgi:cytidine deaminase